VGQKTGNGSSTIIAQCLCGFLQLGTAEFAIAQVACEKKSTVWTSDFQRVRTAGNERLRGPIPRCLAKKVGRTRGQAEGSRQGVSDR
jgi:hypothetical protein